MKESRRIKLKARSIKLDIITDGEVDLTSAADVVDMIADKIRNLTHSTRQHEEATRRLQQSRADAEKAQATKEAVKQALPTVQPSTNGHAKPRAKAAAGK